MKKIILFFFIIFLFLFNLSLVFSVPAVYDVEGTIYELDGVTPIWRSVNISLTNLNKSVLVKGITSKTNPSHFKISISGDSDDLLMLKVWNREHQNNKTFAIGVIKNKTITLDMDLSNYPPEFKSSPITAATEDSLYEYSISVEDYNLDAILLSLVNYTEGMVLEGFKLSWTPAQSDVSANPHHVSILATDGSLFSYQNFSIDAANVNDAPELRGYPQISAKDGSLYTYQIMAADDDNDTLNYFLDAAPSGMTLDNETGLISWTPNLGVAGKKLVRYAASDGVVNVSQEYILFIGPAANNDPTITSAPSLTVNLDEVYTYTLSATDIDGDTIIYELIDGPESAYNVNNVIYWNASAEENLSVTNNLFVVRAIDSNKGSSMQYFYVNVTNISPVLPDDNNNDDGGSHSNKDTAPSLSTGTVQLSESGFIVIKGVKIETLNDTISMYLYHADKFDIAKLIISYDDNYIVEGPDLTIFELAEKPRNINSPNNIVHKYFEINISDHDYEVINFEIWFSVPIRFFQNYNITSQDIVLLRYNDERWAELDTLFVSNESGNYNYKAYAPGFSYFAVAARNAQILDNSNYADTPQYTKPSYALNGVIYNQGFFKTQVDKMTEFLILVNETGQIIKGYTGLLDQKNSGSFSMDIDLLGNETLIFSVFSKDMNKTYSEIISLNDRDFSNIEIIADFRSNSNFGILLKFCLFLVFAFIVFYFYKNDK